ncbi:MULTISPECIES: heme exporter protein CcmD [unclassified Phaeobacter]|uniref:heme exporter protein CcmD n=1 Tax=unclassified Phaeobacter TaxID=2621772 RepID=UPI003A8B0726
MMPDLGKYAVEVLSSYGASLVLLAGLLVITFARGRRIRREMRAMEQQMQTRGGAPRG